MGIVTERRVPRGHRVGFGGPDLSSHILDRSPFAREDIKAISFWLHHLKKPTTALAGRYLPPARKPATPNAPAAPVELTAVARHSPGAQPRRASQHCGILFTDGTGDDLLEQSSQILRPRKAGSRIFCSSNGVPPANLCEASRPLGVHLLTADRKAGFFYMAVLQQTRQF